LLQCAILRHLALVGKPERVVETVYTDILQLPYASSFISKQASPPFAWIVESAMFT